MLHLVGMKFLFLFYFHLRQWSKSCQADPGLGQGRAKSDVLALNPMRARPRQQLLALPLDNVVVLESRPFPTVDFIVMCLTLKVLSSL